LLKKLIVLGKNNKIQKKKKIKIIDNNQKEKLIEKVIEKNKNQRFYPVF